MTSYSLKYEHVPLVKIGSRKVVIDTGSPQTFNLNLRSAPEWDESFPGRVFQTVLHQTGERPDELWGVDKLKSKTLRFDLPGRQLFLGNSAKNLPSAGQRLKSETVGCLPVIHVRIAGRDRRLVLDTGCHHGYLLDVSGMDATLADMVDHSPLVSGGHFSVPAFRGKLELLSRDKRYRSCGPVDFGCVQAVAGIRAALAHYGLDGVVGGLVFRRHVIEFSDQMRRVAVVD
jgi:hypothetical protein